MMSRRSTKNKGVQEGPSAGKKNVPAQLTRRDFLQMGSAAVATLSAGHRVFAVEAK